MRTGSVRDGAGETLGWLGVNGRVSARSIYVGVCRLSLAMPVRSVLLLAPRGQASSRSKAARA
jgi:hypothetical protein